MAHSNFTRFFFILGRVNFKYFFTIVLTKHVQEYRRENSKFDLVQFLLASEVWFYRQCEQKERTSSS